MIRHHVFMPCYIRNGALNAEQPQLQPLTGKSNNSLPIQIIVLSFHVHCTCQTPFSLFVFPLSTAWPNRWCVHPDNPCPIPRGWYGFSSPLLSKSRIDLKGPRYKVGPTTRRWYSSDADMVFIVHVGPVRQVSVPEQVRQARVRVPIDLHWMLSPCKTTGSPSDRT